MKNIFSKALFLALALFSFDLCLDNFHRITFKSDLNHANEAFWSKRSQVTAKSSLTRIPGQIPGPADLWAGGNRKTIKMPIPFGGRYDVTIGFLDSHDSNPPLLEFSLNGEPVFTSKVAKGTGAYSYDWRLRGKKSTIKFRMAGDNSMKYRNTLSIRNMEGSWAAIESVSLARVIPLWKWFLFFPGWIFYFIVLLNVNGRVAVDDESRDTYLDSIAFCLCIALTFIFACSYAGKFQYSDEAYFGGDTWEYQSMGANFAFGYGINRFGGIERFEKYRFTKDSKDKYPDLYESFMSKGRIGAAVNTYRTPGYGVVLGMLYMIYGVSPYVAKLSQLILLIIVAGFLPYVGRGLMGWKGFIAGGMSGYFLLHKWAFEATYSILTEPLIIATIFVTLCAYVMFRRKPGRLSALLFGMVLCFNPLVKGSLVFVPPLFLLLIALENSNIIRKKGATLALVCIGFLMALAPWSAYATASKGGLVVLSTQGSAILPDGNNEMALDGGWHPEWKTKSNSFYKRKDIQNLSSSIKVLLFYSEHTEMIPEIFFNKVNRGFSGFNWFKILALCLIAELLALIIFSVGRRIGWQQGAGWVSMALAASLLLVMARVDPFARLLSVPVQYLAASAALLFVVGIIISKRFPLIAHPALLIYVVNILLVTIITIGEPRFVYVFDVAFMMIGIYYALYLVESFYDAFPYGRQRVEKFSFGR